MRKMMIAVLFSVVSLSACAVEDPQQAQQDPAGDTVVDTAGEHGQQVDPAIEAQPSVPEEAPPSVLDDVNAMMTDNPMDEAEMVSCDRDSDCESTRCDVQTHHCRLYPF